MYVRFKTADEMREEREIEEYEREMRRLQREADLEAAKKRVEDARESGYSPRTVVVERPAPRTVVVERPAPRRTVVVRPERYNTPAETALVGASLLAIGAMVGTAFKK